MLSPLMEEGMERMFQDHIQQSKMNVQGVDTDSSSRLVKSKGSICIILISTQFTKLTSQK